MALIAKNLGHKNFFQLCRILHVTKVNHSHWFPDYKPDAYPKTKEEREAAAKKYNLLPEEYEPYPDDGTGSGDYPKLPYESVDSKDPNYAWDIGTLRRDYMEPIPREMMSLLPEAVSTGRSRYSNTYALTMYISSVMVILGISYFLNKLYIEIPVCKKQYPTPGVVHYSFELDLGLNKTYLGVVIISQLLQV